MITVLLVIIALAGGCVGTYFLMDAPRRRAVEYLAKLKDDRADLEEERDEVSEKERNVAKSARRLAADAADLDHRLTELRKREDEFGRRVVAYDDLTKENAILRSELKTAAVHAAYLEHQQQTTGAVEIALTGERDHLGKEYFEEVVRTVVRDVTIANLSTSQRRVTAAAEFVRKAGVNLSAGIESQALASVLAEYQREVQKQIERERQSSLQKQMREEARRQREAEEAVAFAEREKAAIAAALEKVMAETDGKHAAEIANLQAQLDEAIARSERAKSNAERGIRKGTVYVISNVGSLGPGVFKIGVTRRDEPRDRVDELGDASVPFPFDIHMLVASEDAPRLERDLHHTFHMRRVNRANLRKEYFRASLEEIVGEVQKRHPDAKLELPETASEYLTSQATTDAQLEQMGKAYERVIESIPVAGEIED